MKNSILFGSAVLLFLSACETSRLVPYSDDVYATPVKDKRMAQLAMEAKAKKEAEDKKKEEEAIAAQKAKDDANPYYKDPSYNGDDYYDYAYASRIRRFDSPLNGAGYYDNYYTNSYYYNNSNPYNYGLSIYSSYNWCNPNYPYNGTSLGLSYGYPYNNFGYNSYYNGYNNGYYNGYYGQAYNPYGYYPSYYNPYGYSSNFNNGFFHNGYFHNQWGYLNSYDVNSQYSKMTYAARGSNGGGNSGRMTTAGMAIPKELEGSARTAFFESVVKQQENTPRFTEVVKPVRTDPGKTTSLGNESIPVNGNSNNTYTSPGYNNVNTSGGNSNSGRWNSSPQNVNTGEMNLGNNTGTNTGTRSNNRSGRVSGETNQSQENNGSNNAARPGGLSSPGSSPSSSPSSSPRGNGGGGNGSRPR